MTNTQKGTAYAMASTFASAIVILTGKSLLFTLDIYTFSFYWFGICSAYFILADMRAGGRYMYKVPRKLLPLLILIGIIEAGSALTYFMALKAIDPAFIAFFSNLMLISAPFFGIIFLKEKLTLIEIAGIVIAITGALIMTYEGGITINAGVILLFVSVLLFTVSTMLIKLNNSDISPFTFSGYRCIVVFACATLIGIHTGGFNFSQHISIPVLLIGAFCGPLLSVVLYYYALQYMDMTKVVLIRTTMP
ncbi:MAG: DMT family transporter, partial [Planctomycetes bacterium]|nr:DMT family transporter [Planctomycetota bacterium]